PDGRAARGDVHVAERVVARIAGDVDLSRGHAASGMERGHGLRLHAQRVPCALDLTAEVPGKVLDDGHREILRRGRGREDVFEVVTVDVVRGATHESARATRAEKR